MIDKIMDKLIGTNTSITYFFENFEIGLPEIQGSKGQQIKSVVVNWQLTIAEEYQWNYLLVMVVVMKIIITTTW